MVAEFMESFIELKELESDYQVPEAFALRAERSKAEG